MANADQIILEIKAQFGDTQKQIDTLTHSLDGLGDQVERTNNQAEKSTRSFAGSWTEFRSMYQTVLDVVRVGQQVWAATGQEYINYGDQVQKISRLTGLQADESSRLIQVADDLFISYESLSASLRVAAKNYDVSTEGLAKMADQYKSLGTAQEKAEFASKRFGRNYTEIVKLLEQGGDAIRKMAADQPEGLILNEQDIQNIQEYKRQVDQLNDSFLALKLTIGEKLVPVVGDFLVGIQHQGELIKRTIELMREGVSMDQAKAQALDEVKQKYYGMADGAGAAADGLDTLDEAQQAADESAKKLSQSLTGILSNMFAINSMNEKYADTIAGLDKSDAELIAKKNQLTLAMWEEQRAGKMTNDEYLRYVQQIDDVNKSIDENKQKRTDAADEVAKAGQKQIYDLVQQRLAADGLIDSGEFEYLQDLAVQKGLVTRADAEQAIQASRTADQLVASFQQTQPAMDTALATMLQIKSMDGTIVNFGVNFTQSGSLAGMGGTVNPGRPSNTYNGGYTPINFGSMGSNFHDRDSGGPGMAGTPYLIGTGAQPELFTPSTNGTFTPANKMGNTYNITINNPKKETAENSIRAALKNISFLGQAQNGN